MVVAAVMLFLVILGLCKLSRFEIPVVSSQFRLRLCASTSHFGIDGILFYE